ncbi:MAG: lipoprotein insertase outer membrane protein LolB [Desulfobacteraceae bacterium]|nr:lipoprotein insertase outer membrane protein LolB [Desulfobacteraceae bacterium]
MNLYYAPIILLRGRSTAFVLLLLLLLMALCLNGCAGFFQPPASDESAAQLVAQWRGQNKELTRFKGIFRIRIQTKDQTLNLRAALAAALPDRLRVELLNPLGQPLSSLASDGAQISIVSMEDRKYYHVKQSPTALEPFIHIPIGVEALLETLCGRPALPDFTVVRWAQGDNGTKAVILKDRWNNPLADLQADDSGRIQCLRRFDPDHKIEYEAHWQEWRSIQGYDLPVQVQVKSPDGDAVTWSMERLWTNVELPPQTFVLEPPQGP